MCDKESGRVLRLSKDSLWEKIDNLVEQYKPVNLSKGFPNWKPPSFILDAAVKGIQELNINQYTRSSGFPPLLEELAKKYSSQFNRSIDHQKEVLVTVGALGSLFCAFQAFLNPGDEVIVIEPYFNIYNAQIKFSDGEFVGVPLRYSNDGDSSKHFKLDFNELESKITKKTKMMIFNSPHNPTGKVFTHDEIENICEIVKKHDLILISDEVYECMILSDLPHLHPATFDGMFERTISIGSAGKTFSVTGWKVGWSIGPEPLISAMKFAHLMMAYCVHVPSQYAIKEGFQIAPTKNYYNEFASTLKRNRDRIASAFKEVGLNPIIPDGSYMMLIDFSALELPNESPFFDDNDCLNWKLCKQLIGKHNIATIPSFPFYSPEYQHLAGGILRVCFCKTDDIISDAENAILNLKPYIKCNKTTK